MARLAIIDNGVDGRFFSSSPVQLSIEITKDLEVKKYEMSGDKYITHGTLCAAVIQRIVPKVQLVSIKIVNEIKNRSSVKQLCSALKYCIKNDIQIISISMGVTDLTDVDELKKYVNECVANGIIIVASHSNYGYKTYPACMENVIGVRSTSQMCVKCPYFYQLSYKDPSNHNYVASSSFKIDNAMNENILLPTANSFATPVITAYVYQFVENSNGSYSFKTITSYLNNKSIQADILPEFVHCVPNFFEATKPNIIFCDEHRNFTLPYDIYNYIKAKNYKIIGFTDNASLSKEYGLLELKTLQELKNSNQINGTTLSLITKIYDADIIIVWLTKQSNIKVAPFLNSDISIRFNKKNSEVVEIMDCDKKLCKLNADYKIIVDYIISDFNG